MTIDNAFYDPASLDDVRAMLAAVPDGVIAPDSLTFTRLHEDGGALHTGGGDGIVYAACAVASVVNCPEERDPTLRLIARAPAALAGAIGALDKACQYAVRKRQERDAARARVEALETAMREIAHSTHDGETLAHISLVLDFGLEDWRSIKAAQQRRRTCSSR